MKGKLISTKSVLWWSRFKMHHYIAALCNRGLYKWTVVRNVALSWPNRPSFTKVNWCSVLVYGLNLTRSQLYKICRALIKKMLENLPRILGNLEEFARKYFLLLKICVNGTRGGPWKSRLFWSLTFRGPWEGMNPENQDFFWPYPRAKIIASGAI